MSDLENDSGFVGKSALGYIFDDNIETSGIVSAEQGVQSPLVGADSTSQLYVESDGSISTYNSNGDGVLEIIGNGDGTKFLANDGTYKDIETSGSAAYPYVSVSDVHIYTISPNTFYDFGEISELSVLLGDGYEGVVNEFIFQFQSNEGSILSLPDTVKIVSDFVIESGKTYQVSIVNNIGLIVGV